MSVFRLPARLWARALLGATVALLAGCAQPPSSTTPSGPAGPASGGAGSASTPAPTQRPAPRVSHAANARDYRKDAAAHLYQLNADRIHAGRLPPMLYAIGVLEVDIDRSGQVRQLRWMRAPRHAPEVIKEIERTVHAAAPFPVPERMGKVLYVDTWLWNRNGKFQLDTLSEGQD